VHRPAKKYVISGLGVLSPIGTDNQSFWYSLCSAKSGLSEVSKIDKSLFTTKIAAQLDMDPVINYLGREGRNCSVNTLMSLACAKQIFEDMDHQDFLSKNPVTSVILGSGLGGLYMSQQVMDKLSVRAANKIHPLTVPFVDANSIVSSISRRWQLYGPQYTVSTACSSSAHAIGLALDTLRAGRCDAVLTGGVEATINPLTFAGFDRIGAMSTTVDNPSIACKPFSTDRNGFVMGEGAAMMLIEEETVALSRGARIYAEICGYGSSGGGFHTVKPVEDGTDSVIAMGNALKDAGIGADKIDYINPHGTGTQLNDLAEARALRQVFGDRLSEIPISPTKQLIGHLLGAAGAIESVQLANCLHYQIVTPIKYYNPMGNVKLRIPTVSPMKVPIKYALNNSFGFGNNNVCLIFKRYENE
jgi:3-oxoacyl-[acyl-carrier-protein] synthase II